MHFSIDTLMVTLAVGVFGIVAGVVWIVVRIIEVGWGRVRVFFDRLRINSRKICVTGIWKQTISNLQ